MTALESILERMHTAEAEVARLCEQLKEREWTSIGTPW